MKKSGKRVLVCALDWGIGHATRCIPIIRELISCDAEVIIASSGAAMTLLRNEFPMLEFETLSSYAPVYSRSSAQVAKLLLQIPRFLRTMVREQKETDSIIERRKIDIVISDNRYGCHSKKATSVFITHQITIPAPFFKRALNFFNRRQIRKFDFCWIPDHHGAESLSGQLSEGMNLNTTFIGPLSRFSPLKLPVLYDVVGVLSGPEPQRSLLEDILKNAFRKTDLRTFLVCGSFDQKHDLSQRSDEVNFLTSDALMKTIAEANIIIARSGYSTIMDLSAMGQKAIFIPTPGQPEQEYLAERLMKAGVASFARQDTFNLDEALKKAANFTGFKPSSSPGLLTEAINDLLK